MPEAPVGSEADVGTLENLEFKYKRIGGFGGNAIYHKKGGKYYPQITEVGTGRFSEWGVQNDDVLLSGTYNGVSYDFGDSKQFEGGDKFYNLEAFKEVLRNSASTGFLSTTALKGITLKVLRNAKKDETQTASPTTPAKPPRSAAELKLYVISGSP